MRSTQAPTSTLGSEDAPHYLCDKYWIQHEVHRLHAFGHFVRLSKECFQLFCFADTKRQKLDGVEQSAKGFYSVTP